MPRIIDRAQAIRRIRARALTITSSYRLAWSIYDRCFYVTHKHDRRRRYRISARGCDCPCRRFYGTCKHWLGLADLVRVEIARYTLLGYTGDLARMRVLLEDYSDRNGRQGIGE